MRYGSEPGTCEESAVTGLPQVTVPAGFLGGRYPVGHLVSRPHVGRSAAARDRRRLRAGDAPSSSAVDGAVGAQGILVVYGHSSPIKKRRTDVTACCRLVVSVLLALCWAVVTASAQPYSARRSGEVVQLEDARSQTVVSILPAVGNIAFTMKVKGHDILRWPYASVDEFKARPALSGIPFIGPWANRLDEQAFYANGKRYPFDMELGNVRGAIPIHGFLTTTDRWQVIEVKVGRRGGLGHEPARVLPPAGVDEAVAVRAHHRAHLQTGKRRARSPDGDHEPERRGDAGGDRIPSLLPVDRFTAQHMDRRDRCANALAARTDQGPDRRNRISRRPLSQSAIGHARRLQSRRCVFGSGARSAEVAPRCR